MAWPRENARPPTQLLTDEFLLRAIRVSDAELDYEAVMESREFLRVWEQSTWPEDDFTVEANRDDLARLERRHRDGASFTYTVMDRAETECLGCVYIFPTDARLFTARDISAVDGGPAWSAYEAAAYFWVRASRLADELDRRLLDALRTWLTADWRIEDPLVLTNEQFDQQVALIESTDLRLTFRLTTSGKPGRELAYASGAAAASR